MRQYGHLGIDDTCEVTLPIAHSERRPLNTLGEEIISGKVTEACDEIGTSGTAKEKLQANPWKVLFWIKDNGGITQVAAIVVDEEIN